MLSVKDKVDWLREYAPSSIRCDAEGVWLDYQHNRITQRQAVIRLNKWIKAAHRERPYLMHLYRGAMGLITG